MSEGLSILQAKSKAGFIAKTRYRSILKKTKYNCNVMKLALPLDQKAQLGRIAAKQFLLITDCWKIKDNQRRVLAGAATRTTISTWRKKVNTLDELQLGNDTYERLICIYDINKLLSDTFIVGVTEEENSQTIASAIRQTHHYFDHSSLLDVMLKGWVINLYQVKDYLESSSKQQALFIPQSNQYQTN